jgi:hypothetical protein
MNEQTEKYYFTFGSGQLHEGSFVVIETTSADLARKRMVDMYGLKWSMQYSESDWIDKDGISQDKKYGYTELK